MVFSEGKKISCSFHDCSAGRFRAAPKLMAEIFLSRVSDFYLGRATPRVQVSWLADIELDTEGGRLHNCPVSRISS